MQLNNSPFLKKAAIALILSAVLLILTMGLHPTGGSFEHLVETVTIGITAHSIALIALLMGMFGYHSFYKSLPQQSILAVAGYISMMVAQVAGMLAGAINGLAIPMYVYRNRMLDSAQAEDIIPIIRFGLSLNHAFDFITIGFIAMGILSWSLLFIRKQILPKWLGWYGVLINSSLFLLIPYGMQVLTVKGFTVFIGIVVSWIVLLGISLYNQKPRIIQTDSSAD